jgi:hypothetical protein
MKWKTGSYSQVTPEVDIVKWANQPLSETFRPNTRKAKADAKRMLEFYRTLQHLAWIATV